MIRHSSRRGVAKVTQVIDATDADYKSWMDSLPIHQDTEAAILAGLGLGDYFKFGKGSSEGIQGSIKQIIEL